MPFFFLIFVVLFTEIAESAKDGFCYYAIRDGETFETSKPCESKVEHIWKQLKEKGPKKSRKNLSGCNRTLFVSSYPKLLQSHPQFGDKKYPSNRDCTWKIKSDKYLTIELRFNTFKVENTTACGKDFVEIRHSCSRHRRETTFTPYCGAKAPPPANYSCHHLSIRFHSDASINDEGFNATFTGFRRRRNGRSKRFSLEMLWNTSGKADRGKITPESP